MGTDRPLIGLTTYREPADWRGWPGVLADIVPTDYSMSVEQAGGAPVLLPPVASEEVARAIAARLDGLVVIGGADVNPARYGEEPLPEVAVWQDHRDSSELAYLAVAEELSLPVLGVCRGMQLLAVAAGGTLEQHLPNVLGTDLHSGGQTNYSEVDVLIESGHRISSLIPGQLRVNCHHHQGVLTHPGFVRTAVSADGALHAMEKPGDRFVMGVQWHPETGVELGLFSGLVEAARHRSLHGVHV